MIVISCYSLQGAAQECLILDNEAEVRRASEGG